MASKPKKTGQQVLKGINVRTDTKSFNTAVLEAITLNPDSSVTVKLEGDSPFTLHGISARQAWTCINELSYPRGSRKNI